MINYATRFPPGKPIKLLNDTTVRKTVYSNIDKSFQFMEVLIKHFINHPDPIVVPIFSYQILQNKRNNYSYSYDMMRLALLSKEERDIIDDAAVLADHYGKGFWRRASPRLLTKAMQYPKLNLFLETISYQGRYFDLHSGNVMMDMDREYKLIDIEGFINLPFNIPENSWITNEC